MRKGKNYFRASFTMPQEMIDKIEAESVRRKQCGLEGSNASSLIRLAVRRFMNEWSILQQKGVDDAPRVD
jgi:hypothetical protein